VALTFEPPWPLHPTRNFHADDRLRVPATLARPDARLQRPVIDPAAPSRTRAGARPTSRTRLLSRTMTDAHTVDIAAVRAAFPALGGPTPYVFADNAGGSQCLRGVADAISDYLLRTNVQLGADYAVSVSATARVDEGKEAARELFNAERVDEVVFGSSSTQVCANLARAMEGDIQDGDEFILTPEHEGARLVPARLIPR
jgi:hypothetical protein